MDNDAIDIGVLFAIQLECAITGHNLGLVERDEVNFLLQWNAKSSVSMVEMVGTNQIRFYNL